MGQPSDNLDRLRSHKHSNYVHQEYPKWITRFDGKKLIVQDEYEEGQIKEEDEKLVKSKKAQPPAQELVQGGKKPSLTNVQKLTPKLKSPFVTSPNDLCAAEQKLLQEKNPLLNTIIPPDAA